MPTAPNARAHMSLTETAGSERDPHVGQPSGQLKKFEGEENGVERERGRGREREVSEAEKWADGTVEIQKSRTNTIFFHREPSLVPSLPISNSQLVWNDWKSWERCRAWISSICVHWMRAGKVIPNPTSYTIRGSKETGLGIC